MRGLHGLAVITATVTIGATGMSGVTAVMLSHPAPPRAVTTVSAKVCPAHLLSLPAAGVQRAADRALARAAKLYPDQNTRGAEVMAADRSAFAGARGREVGNMCGKKVASRTVVVQMLFPRMLPSASLSEAVVFVGKVARGYRVWYLAH